MCICSFYTNEERHYTVSNGEVEYTVPFGFFPHSYIPNPKSKPNTQHEIPNTAMPLT